MERKLPEQRLAAQWFFSSLLICAGMWIAVNVEWVLGVTTASFYGAYFISFIMNLIAGLIFVAITVEVAKDI